MTLTCLVTELQCI